MPWTEHQQALLRAMGLRTWTAPAGPAADGPACAARDEAPAPAAPPPPATAQAAPPSPAPTPGPAPALLPGAAPASTPAPTPGRTPASTPALAGAAPAAAPVALEPRPASAALDWPDLRAAVAGCRACGLCASRQQTVFGVGHPQAHWMVVGEAPGEQEDLSGEPFVGPAGQLLDRMLAALRLTRAVDGPEPPSQRVFITNTLKCRPPRNRNPAPDEMAQCEPFLLRQIELLQPRIILAMGAFAVKALLRSSDPVGRLRGRVHRYHGVPLVVTYHPAYLLRNLPDKARAWEDLCLAAEAADAAQALADAARTGT